MSFTYFMLSLPVGPKNESKDLFVVIVVLQNLCHSSNRRRECIISFAEPENWRKKINFLFSLKMWTHL